MQDELLKVTTELQTVSVISLCKCGQRASPRLIRIKLDLTHLHTKILQIREKG